MKKSLITIALAGLAGAALSVSTANAQVNAVPGDLILGFFATSGTGAGQDLEVDLGNASVFDSATGTLNLVGPAALAQADLVATYGANWASNPDLEWGVIAGNATTAVTGAPTSSIWETDPVAEADASTLGLPPGSNSYTPPNAGTRIQQAGPSLVASGPPGGFQQNGTVHTPNSTESVVVAESVGLAYLNYDEHINGQSFTWSPGNLSADNPILNTTASGNSLSNLYSYFDTNAGKPGVLLGTFDLNGGVAPGSSFSFTYTAAAVPEPSSIGLTGVGFLSLIGFVALRRRRSIMA